MPNRHGAPEETFVTPKKQICVLVKLDSPPWKENDADVAHTPLPLPPAPADVMRSWSVARAAVFLERCDLRGAAKTCADNGVNGIDLMDISLETLMDDLRMARFGARKVIDARDAFLAGRCDPLGTA